MNISIKLVSKPERLSSSTLNAALSHLQNEIAQSVFKTMCRMNITTSRNRIQKFVYENIHLDIEKVERGSFIIFFVGSLAATVTLCIYEVIKNKMTHRITEDDIRRHVEDYQEPILRDLIDQIKSEKRLGTLHISDVKSDLKIEEKNIMRLSLDIELSLPKRDKEHTPADTEGQIKFVAEQLKSKNTSREQ